MADAEECRWCGALHGKMCPHVKALEFDPATSAVVRVEFLTPADYPRWAAQDDEPAADYPRLGKT